MTAEEEIISILKARLDEYEEIGNRRIVARVRELKEIDDLRERLDRSDSIISVLIMMIIMLGLPILSYLIRKYFPIAGLTRPTH